MAGDEGEKPQAKNKSRGKLAGRRAGVGGARLARSETVTVRLDPKLRYLAELAARKQRRTLSSFIEWAIEESLKTITLSESNNRNIFEMAGELWDVDEPDRFAVLAFHNSQMLTHDEQVLWKLICENPFFWRHGGTAYSISRDFLRFDRLRQHWATLCSVARGTADKAILPRGEMDDEIPRGEMDDEIPPGDFE